MGIPRNFSPKRPVFIPSPRVLAVDEVPDHCLVTSTNTPIMKIRLLIATCLAAFALPATADETEWGK